MTTQDPTEPTLLARRTDGFGERMRAILTGLALSDALGLRFRFQWAPKTHPRDQSLPAAAEIFDAAFLDRHLAAEGETRGARVMDLEAFARRSGKAPAKAASGAFVEVPKEVPDPGRLGLTGQAWAEALAGGFRRITFSDKMRRAYDLAHGLEGLDGAVAIHLRAGDIVYGNFRVRDAYRHKVCPYPVVRHLVSMVRAQGRKVVLLGQDPALMAALSGSSGAGPAESEPSGSGASEVVPEYELDGFGDLDPHQRMIFDIALMSRCAEIYSGGSGFAIFASAIASARQISATDYIRQNDLGGLIEEEVLHGDRTGIPPLQVAFAARYAMVLRDERFPKTETGHRLLGVCRAHDPDNFFYEFIAACDAQRTAATAEPVPAMVACFSRPRKDGKELVRCLSDHRSNRSYVPRECIETIDLLLGTGFPGALFARCLVALTNGDVAEAQARQEAFRKAAGTTYGHLVGALDRHVQAAAPASAGTAPAGRSAGPPRGRDRPHSLPC